MANKIQELLFTLKYTYIIAVKIDKNFCSRHVYQWQKFKNFCYHAIKILLFTYIIAVKTMANKIQKLLFTLKYTYIIAVETIANKIQELLFTLKYTYIIAVKTMAMA